MDENPTKIINIIPDSLQQKIKAARESFLNTTRFQEVKEFVSLLGFIPTDEYILTHYLEFDRAFGANLVCRMCDDYQKCPHDPKGYKPTLEWAVGWEPCFRQCQVTTRFIQCEKDELYQVQIKVQKLLESSRLPERFKRKTFETFKAGSGTKNAYEKALKFCIDGGRGIVFAGPPGVGKTHLAGAIMNFKINQCQECVFCTVPELLEDIRRSIKTDKGSSELMEIVKNTPILILDDLGAEKMTEWVSEQLFIIFNARLVRDLKTIITTNFELPENLIDKLGGGLTGQRIVSRILEMCEWLVITGDDYRLKD